MYNIRKLTNEYTNLWYEYNKIVQDMKLNEIDISEKFFIYNTNLINNNTNLYNEENHMYKVHSVENYGCIYDELELPNMYDEYDLCYILIFYKYEFILARYGIINIDSYLTDEIHYFDENQKLLKYCNLPNNIKDLIFWSLIQQNYL